jgi:hypothetical protein
MRSLAFSATVLFLLLPVAPVGAQDGNAALSNYSGLVHVAAKAFARRP